MWMANHHQQNSSIDCLGQNFSSAAINQIIDLNASASSNLPVTYVVSDTSMAELAVTLQNNLDSWWKLDESSATTVADSSVVELAPILPS